MKKIRRKGYRFYPLLLVALVLACAGFALLVQASGETRLSYAAEPELVIDGLEAFDGEAVRLAAVGDVRSGDQRQAQVAALLDALQLKVALDGVILLGDNTLLRGAPARSLEKTFLRPYAFLIERKVPFYAVLGNHDLRRGMKEYQLYFPYYNMNGRPYYSKVFGEGIVEVFFLDSNKIQKDAQQVAWLEQALAQSSSQWQVVAMHHPLFSTAKHHPAERSLQELLEPILIEHGVDLVLTGHNHIYERLHPINGINYITAGSGGELNEDDLEKDNPLRAAGNDRQNVALMLDFTADSCQFAAFTPQGKVVDKGTAKRNGEAQIAELKGSEPVGEMSSGGDEKITPSVSAGRQR